MSGFLLLRAQADMAKKKGHTCSSTIMLPHLLKKYHVYDLKKP